MTDELKQCPFCGGTPAINYGHIAGTSFAYVVCACGVTTKNQHGDSDREAAKKALQIWNTRAERTCRQGRLFNLIRRECDGELYQWREEEKPNYCPNCGAKVVEQ